MIAVQSSSPRSLIVDMDRLRQVLGNEKIIIGKNRNKDIGGNETIHIGRSQIETIKLTNIQNVGMVKMVNVGLAMSTVVGIAKAEAVGVYKGVLVGGNYSDKTGGNRDSTVNGNRNAVIDGNEAIQAKNVTIIASEKLELQSGDAIITLQGGNVMVNAKAMFIEAPVFAQSYGYMGAGLGGMSTVSSHSGRQRSGGSGRQRRRRSRNRSSGGSQIAQPASARALTARDLHPPRPPIEVDMYRLIK